MTSRDRVLLTGGTGLIGHHVLASLIAARQPVAALLRRGEADLARLDVLLEPLGVRVADALRAGLLHVIAGDVCEGIAEAPTSVRIRAVIHAAACTRFEADRAGDPYRTNVLGTSNLLRWVDAHHVERMLLVSTAYVCGRSPAQPVHETVNDHVCAFHNDYERSKWMAERLCRDWRAHDRARRLSILRPSIVVGEFASGRTTKFTGFYLALRAADAVARLRQESGEAPEIVRLRGSAHHRQNIVPVDYVARMIAAMVDDPSEAEGVFHLVHPHPPSNGAIARAIEEHLDLRCTRFADDANERGVDQRHRLERVFDRLAAPVEPYIADAPEFARVAAAAVERRAGISCPAFDHAALLRLCAFATSTREPVEAPASGGDSAGAEAAEYFHRFLPEHLSGSRVARMHEVSATVRFVLTDIADGQWVCRFEGGRLAQVHRGCNGLREDFGYRTTSDVFVAAVAGMLEPQQAFLARRAEVFGDIERGLKMAMVLREFHRECPFPGEAARA